MFGFEGELEIDDVWAFEPHHNITLIANHALLSSFKESFLLHKFEGVEDSISLESR
jgi:hypothetical protein